MCNSIRFPNTSESSPTIFAAGSQTDFFEAYHLREETVPSSNGGGTMHALGSKISHQSLVESGCHGKAMVLNPDIFAWYLPIQNGGFFHSCFLIYRTCTHEQDLLNAT